MASGVEMIFLWAAGIGLIAGVLLAAGGLAFTLLGARGRPVSVKTAATTFGAGIVVLIVAAIFYVLVGGTLIVGPVTFR